MEDHIRGLVLAHERDDDEKGRFHLVELACAFAALMTRAVVALEKIANRD